MPPDAATAGAAIDDREELPGGRRAERLKVHVRRGQLRLGLQREDPPVVVSSDSDVVRYPPAQLVQGHQDARSDLVGSAEHRVDIGLLRKQGGSGRAGPAL